jgi:hypothetical protein
VSDADMKKAEAKLLKLQELWRKRKRGCNEIIDMICESAEMNRKEFMVRYSK